MSTIPPPTNAPNIPVTSIRTAPTRPFFKAPGIFQPPTLDKDSASQHSSINNTKQGAKNLLPLYRRCLSLDLNPEGEASKLPGDSEYIRLQKVRVVEYG